VQVMTPEYKQSRPSCGS